MVQIEKGMPMRSKAERSAMPVTMPGSAIGRTNSSEIASRPKKLRARQRGGGERAEDQREHGGDRGDLEREIERRPDIGPLRPGDAEPLRGVAGRRELEAPVLGGEGVEQDQRQRQMQEQRAPRSAAMRRACAACRAVRPQRTSNAPMRLATQR